jgi:aminopeptidase N
VKHKLTFFPFQSSRAYPHVLFTQQAAADNIKAPDGSALDFKELLDPWFNQMGFPLLTVSNSGDGTASVASARFFNPIEQSPDTPSYFK